MNYNESLESMLLAEVRKSGTRWVRGFIEMNDVSPDSDSWKEDLAAMSRALDAGHHVVISLKWRHQRNDFAAPGSAAFSRQLDALDLVLAEVMGKADKLVIGNEPFIETDETYIDEDLNVFYEAVAAHVIAYKQANCAAACKTDLYMGALNRLDLEEKRTPEVDRFLAFIRQTPELQGVDLHLHLPDLSGVEPFLDYSLSRLRDDQDFLVTEFSLVWKWRQHRNDPIPADFAARHGYAPDMKVHEFIDAALKDPVSAEIWADFTRSADWYRESGDAVEQMVTAFRETGRLSVANYAAKQIWRKSDYTDETTPWILNSLFASAVMPEKGNGLGEVNPLWIDDFRRLNADLDIDTDERWTRERINAWYDDQPWLVGANYVPRSAINQLEMWQAETFNPDQIDEELGWAADIGMNTMRVFLHDIAWRQDPEGFLDRVDTYLDIADSHGIKTLVVIFDDVWHPFPQAGTQPSPVPGVHNSGWVQSPGQLYLGDIQRHDELKPYVQSVLKRFADDDRVLAWDLYNEPGNLIGNSYGRNGTNEEMLQKAGYSLLLLDAVFDWAREVDPSQPLTASMWHAPGGRNTFFADEAGQFPGRHTLHAINALILERSDLLSWHNYTHVDTFEAEIDALDQFDRPLMLTEYLAREAPNADGTNSFAGFLPVAKAHKVGMYNWGLVSGKSQTIYPWHSWDKPMTAPPALWHHDIFYPDGRPFDPAETEFIRQLTDETESSSE